MDEVINNSSRQGQESSAEPWPNVVDEIAAGLYASAHNPINPGNTVLHAHVLIYSYLPS